MFPTEAVLIALDGARLLADVRGVNDHNLRELERLIGVRVFVRCMTVATSYAIRSLGES